MHWWQAALWALAGGFVVEALEFSATLSRYRKWPWRVDAEAAPTAEGTAAGPLGYAIGELLRLGAGGVLGAALASQVSGPLAALAIGAAAPAIAGQLATFAPLPQAQPASGVGAVPDELDASARVLTAPSEGTAGTSTSIMSAPERPGDRARRKRERGRTK